MKTKTNYRWVMRIVLISVICSVTFTFASTEILGRLGYLFALLILAVFIFLGILFDIIGVSVTAASVAPFHSMAAHRERGAVEALRLIKNAEKVSSFCNDVVGDVSGIVSGATASLVVANISESGENVALTLIVSGAVTGVTIGGKALGKTIAINNSTSIVLKVGRLINLRTKISAKK